MWQVLRCLSKLRSNSFLLRFVNELQIVDRYYFLETDTNMKSDIDGPMLSGISYHCKVRICISADNLVCPYIGHSLSTNALDPYMVVINRTSMFALPSVIQHSSTLLQNLAYEKEKCSTGHKIHNEALHSA